MRTLIFAWLIAFAASAGFAQPGAQAPAGGANDFHIQFLRGTPGGTSAPWGDPEQPQLNTLVFKGQMLTAGQMLAFPDWKLTDDAVNAIFVIHDAWWTIDGERVADASLILNLRGPPVHIPWADLAQHKWAVVIPVPEPKSWMLLIAGFGALGWALRRPRKVAESAFG